MGTLRRKKIMSREWRETEVSPAAGQKAKSGAQVKAKNGRIIVKGGKRRIWEGITISNAFLP